MDVGGTPIRASEPGRSGEQAVQIGIRLGLLVLLIYWSFLLLQPFIPILAWSVVLAVALYPVYSRLSEYLGHRPRIAAAVMTLVLLAVFLGPATWLGLGLVDGLRSIFDQLTSGDLTIPSPPDSIRDWPLIGTTLHEFWKMASDNLQAALHQFAPYLKPLAGPILAIAGSAGTGMLKFLMAVVIAGFLFPSGPKLVASVRTMLTRIVPPRSADFLALAGATIRTVEVFVWSIAYGIVNAAPEGTDLFYFAFVNYTTLGYGDVTPVAQWRLLGPMAAMNGVLLFGWSTAIIFEVLRKALSQHASFESS